MKKNVMLFIMISCIYWLFAQAYPIAKELNLSAKMETLQSDKLDSGNSTAVSESENSYIEREEEIPIPLYKSDKGDRTSYTAIFSSNWNNSMTWGGSGVPVAGDAVTINTGITVTIPDGYNAACTSITINGTGAITCAGNGTLSTGTISFANNGTITISANGTITTSGTVTMAKPSSGSSNININAGTATFAALTMNATTSGKNNIITITTGSLTVSGALTTGTTGCQFNITGAGILNFVGTRSGSPTITTVSGSTVKIGTGTLTSNQFSAMTLPQGSNLVYSGNSAQTVYATTYANCNLGFEGTGTKTIAASALVQLTNGSINNSSTLVLTAGTSTTSTRLYVGGNFYNNDGATFTATANYTILYFIGTAAQTFTNNGNITAPLYSMSLGNSAGLTLAGNNQIPLQRINLYYGTIYNSNKITLGNGGNSYGVVQIGASTSYPRGYFDQYPTFNAGLGGYQLLYAPANASYSTSYEVPPNGEVAYFYIVCGSGVTVSMNQDITVPYVYTTGLNLESGNLSIGPHTLTIKGNVGVTSGTLTGGSTSNVVYCEDAWTILPPVSGGLANLTFDTTGYITMTGAVTVNNSLTLGNGIITNESYLTIANGATIYKSFGELKTTPAYSGTVNLIYTGNEPVKAGKELPTGTTVINNLTTNPGGFTQYAYNENSTNLLTENFVAGLTGWAGDIAQSTSMKFYSSNTTNAGGTSPEVRYYSLETTHQNVTNEMHKTASINTAGYNYLNFTFKTMGSGNYVTEYDTYLKLQSATSLSGPWHDVWSYPYWAHSASTAISMNYTTDIGGEMYLRFAFIGDPYALDAWYFDNLVVDGVKITEVASNITVNGTLNIVGDYTIGSGNTLTMANNATINRSSGTLSAAPNFGTNINLIYSGSSPIITGFESNPNGNYNVTINNSAGVTLGADMIINNLLTFTAGTLALNNQILTLTGKDFSISGSNSLSALAVTLSNNSQTIEGGSSISHTWNIGGSATGFLTLRLSWLNTYDNNETFNLGGVVYRYNGTTWNYVTNSDVITLDNVRHLSYEYNFGAKANNNDVTIKGAVLPVVYTQPVTEIGKYTATGNGTISSKGIPAEIIQYGVCWSTDENPTIANSHSEEGEATDIGTYTSALTDLLPATLYYVRAYATNNTGTAYGDQVSFTTNNLYDYPEGIEVPVGENTICFTLGNANNGSGEIPSYNNPNFTLLASFIFELIDSGPWSIEITTTSPWGAYYLSSQWNAVQNSGGKIIFNNITASKNLILRIILGDQDPTLPVELSSFTANINSQGGITVMWATQSETGVNGYYVNRATVNNLSEALRISSLIPASNTSQQQVYVYNDNELYEPGTYYYWLEIQDIDGIVSYYGSRSVTFGGNGNNGTPEIPLVTGIRSIYPNPFNPSATIMYELDQPANVTIEIFNNRGQIVRSFALGKKDTGYYRLVWDGTDNSGSACGTGIYFVKMQAGKETFLKKAALVK
jgi:hypothetical protein